MSIAADTSCAKKRRTLHLSGAALALSMGWATWTTWTMSAAYADPQPLAASSLASVEAARRAQSVATFTSGRITVGELEDAILAQNPLMQQRFQTHEAVHAVLDQNVRFALLAAEAERRGYGQAAETVLAQRQGAVQALIARDFDAAITPESIPETDVRAYYDAHQDELVRGEARRASVLLLRDAPAAEALLARAKAADLRAFRELVRSASVDQTTKHSGGDLAYFDVNGRLLDDEVGSVDAATAKVAFSLHEVGDTSAVTQLGQYAGIVRLTGIRPAQDESYAKNEQRLRMRLWRERRQAAIDTHLDSLKRQLNVRVRPELVESVQLETGPALPPSRGLPSGFPHIPSGSQHDSAHSDEQPR